jgi:hypothetical protein
MSHDPNDPFDVQKEPYPFTEWEDLKYTLWAFLALASPLIFIALAVVFVLDWLT